MPVVKLDEVEKFKAELDKQGMDALVLDEKLLEELNERAHEILHMIMDRTTLVVPKDGMAILALGVDGMLQGGATPESILEYTKALVEGSPRRDS